MENRKYLQISKDFGTFDAAHQLPLHDGKCANLHGHTYRVEATFSGLIETGANPQQGMVVDFGVVKDIYKRRVETRLDHSLILGTHPLSWVVSLVGWYPNPEGADEEAIVRFIEDMKINGIRKVAYLPIPVTTAEWLAFWIMKELRLGLEDWRNEFYGRDPLVPSVERVRVYETPSSMAEAIRGYRGPEWE